MKVYLSYILFLALALKPIYNVGYLAYFELNIDYIVKTYCVNKSKPKLACNGKCHLAQQLVKVADKSSQDTHVASLLEMFVPVYFQEYKTPVFKTINSFFTHKYWGYKFALNTVYLGETDPPPQV